MNLSLISIYDIGEIKKKIDSTELPFQTAYKFTRLFNALEVEAKFYLDSLQKIINEYAYHDENNNIEYLDENQKLIKINKDKEAECYKRLNELGEVEVEVPDIFFTINELSILNLTPIEVKKILPFIKEDQD